MSSWDSRQSPTPTPTPMSLSSGRYREPPPELRQGTESLKSCRLPHWGTQATPSLVSELVCARKSFCEQCMLSAPSPWHGCSRPSLESQHPGILIIRKHCDCTEPSHSHQALNHLDVSLSLLVNFVFSYFCICTLYILIPVSPPLSPSKFLKTPVTT